jgi:ribosomal protein S21
LEFGAWDLSWRGVFFIMVVVKKMPGQSDDMLIKKFARKVLNEGILPEVKRRQFHLKPSLARKMKREEARRAKKSAYGYRSS